VAVQTCWVTRSAPEGHEALWRANFEYLLNSPDIRSVALDKGSRWDWGWGQQIPVDLYRVFQRLYGEGPRAVLTFHDDIAAPTHPDFPAYFNRWVENGPRCLTTQSVQMWGSYHDVRLDYDGCEDWHCFGVKWDPRISFVRNGSGSYDGLLFPMGQRSHWRCPYPTRHLKYAELETLAGGGVDRRGLVQERIRKKWLYTEKAVVIPWTDDLLWDQVQELRREARERLPAGAREFTPCRYT
jgi:hypothetical protein